jgi:hypothetical protein
MFFCVQRYNKSLKPGDFEHFNDFMSNRDEMPERREQGGRKTILKLWIRKKKRNGKSKTDTHKA